MYIFDNIHIRHSKKQSVARYENIQNTKTKQEKDDGHCKLDKTDCLILRSDDTITLTEC